MLFNSYIFIFLFLPVTLIVYYRLSVAGHREVAIAWLVSASLFFYAWWNTAYLLLLLGSIVFNYFFGGWLGQSKNLLRAEQKTIRRIILAFGISVNLLTIAYFKYANFFVDNSNYLFNNNYHFESIILPLAISFFTFQQITYLVDAYRGETREYNFLHYCLFVVFFPQLIAGPIVHHREMMPQFLQESTFKCSQNRIAIGSAIFITGLFKKVVIADSIALYSTPMFMAAQKGEMISFFEAWGGSLSYTFQLYFDFSGYSDMAVGLAYLFGIRLALNFFSPYKANNIREFWRRWHITLSRFLRDYLYFPLGGNKKGPVRRHVNIMMTMLLGGLWHGAGWTFVVWGALHGMYLVLNNIWRAVYVAVVGKTDHNSWWGVIVARLITFLAIVIAWVFFRAESFPAAIEILKGMSGVNGIILPPSYFDYLNKLFSLGDTLQSIGWQFKDNTPYFGGFGQIFLLILLLMVVWFTPNTYQIFVNYSSYIDSTRVAVESKYDLPVVWRPTAIVAVTISAMFIAVIFKMDLTSEFLYFQF